MSDDNCEECARLREEKRKLLKSLEKANALILALEEENKHLMEYIEDNRGGFADDK
jgi:hypothetical protein